MTNRDASLNPIRPNLGEVDNNVQEELAGTVAGQPGDGIDGDKDKEKESRAEVDEEVRKPRPAVRPYTPTKAEVYEHEVTHLPYRTWCKHCVRGRGVSTPHRQGSREEKMGITISLDYCFMNGEDEDEQDVPKILIMYDDHRECLWAIPVEQKARWNGW